MSKLTKILLNLGEADLQSIGGKEAVRLISNIDERIVSKANLVTLILARHGDDILFKENVRKIILLALNRSDADNLLFSINKNKNNNPWESLVNETYTYNSIAVAKLHEFFEVPLPLQEEKNSDKPAVRKIVGQYALYPYQLQVVNKALERLLSGPGRVLVHMPTGAGKTRSAMSIIAQFLKRQNKNAVVVWLAHSEELCEQASSEFEKCWLSLGDRELNIGRFYSGYEFDLSSFKEGVIVAGLAKIYSRSLSQQSQFLKLKKSVKFVVMDEAHQAIAPTYRHLLDMLAPAGGASLLGLSATPGRSWLDMNQDKELADFFDGQKISLEVKGYRNPIIFLQEQGYLAIPEYTFIPHNPSIHLSSKELQNLADGFDISLETIKKLGDDEQRNLLILKEILFEVNNKSKIIVFACSVENAFLLADVLLLRGVRARAVSAKSSTAYRRSAINLFKEEGPESVQVLVNFGIFTTGFDAPKTNVAVIARPTQSVVLYSQMIGRAMRGPAVGGNEKCKIITVVDALQGFRSVHEGFSHWEDVWSENNEH